MVEVFKTNIQDKSTASKVLEDLYRHFPGYKINFDLEDCDKILRIENEKVVPGEVLKILNHNGYFCEVLE
ncbi:MAG: hypothetical protein L0Y79_05585 [Chlorobi bacterium]|nr:hypothetical protein [Chlorobiota bacterium]MCI0716366.1 hypothetical protein [Chlorobiota bacterium]